MEIREIWTSDELSQYLDFPNVGQVFCIRRHICRLKDDKQSTETVYGITSLLSSQASAKRVLELNRNHWGIENKLHWVRDVTFDEDRSQVRTGSAPRVMATLRNLTINLFRFFSVTNIARTLRTYAAKPYLALRLIGI